MRNSREGKLANDNWPRLFDAMGRWMKAIPLIIDDHVHLNVAQMPARARRVKRKHGLHLVIVHYLQLVRGDGDNRNGRRPASAVGSSSWHASSRSQ